ncbi:MAG: serine hydrolase domain-containing protein [Candidatus Woesearchaeota archaeon]
MKREAVEDVCRILDTWITYQWFHRRIPGLAVGVIHEDKIVWTKYLGHADVEAKKPVTKDTQFCIASISKSFTATACMLLVQDGKLNLDDPVKKYVPWFTGNGLDDITIRMLLRQSSGIIRNGLTDYWALKTQFPDEKTLKEWAPKLVAITPDTRFKYSNVGYGILGLVVAKASGLSYSQFIKKRVFTSLGMKKTTTSVSEATSLAKGYTLDIPGTNRELIPTPDAHALNSATGYVATLPDLLQYLAIHYGSKKLLSDKSRKEMQDVSWKHEGTEKYGFGIDKVQMEGESCFGHGGVYPGFMSSMGFLPEEKIGIVVLTNADDGPAKDLRHKALSIVLFGKTKWKGPKNVTLDKYAGIFALPPRRINATSRFGANVILYGPRAANPLNRPLILEHVKDDEFLAIDGSGHAKIGEPVIFTIKDGKAVKICVQAQCADRVEPPT